jgi:hypothetical protein
MSMLYKRHANHSQFIVQAFPTGLLSFVGHSPTFACPGTP